MKIILVHIFCLITVLSLYSQKNFEINDAKSFYLDISGQTYKGQERLPFKNIIIKDFRFDTTKFGYLRKTKISLMKNNAEGLSEILNRYYKNTLDPNADKSLVVILKKLWIQKDAADIVSTDKIRPDFGLNAGDNTGACIADIEAFCQFGDKLYPLLKITDNFYYYPYTQSTMVDFMLFPFDSLLKKSSTINTELLITNRKSYTWEQINTGYSERFNLPILSATFTSKGIFTSFEAFKKNETIYPDFIVKKSKINDDLYIINNGKEELLLDLWGFYDGKDYYIKSGFSFYKLIRQNNTWDIFGSKFITEKYRSYAFDNGTLNTLATKLERKPLQLDMETGKLY